jgi:hypothetical protein
MAINQPRVIEPKIRSAYNNSGSTIAKGTIVKLNPTTPAFAGEVVKAAANSDTLYGVTMMDIPTATWGDVQVSGVAVVLCGTASVVTARLTSDASGKTITWASGQSLLGIALTPGVVADVYHEVELAGPGGATT